MNQRVTQILLGLLVILLGAILYRISPADAADAAAVPKVVQAQGFELVNASGQVVGQLYCGEDGGGNLRFRGANGEVRVKLGGDNKGAGLVLMDARTEPTVNLRTADTGTSLTLMEEGKDALTLAP